MKIRNGFVSNSSSSSFIIIGDTSFIPDTVDYEELNMDQKRKLAVGGAIKNVEDFKGKVTLTEYLHDSGDDLYEIEYTDEECNNERPNVIEYNSSKHGEIYSEVFGRDY